MLSKSTRGPKLALALFLAMLGIGFHTHAAYAQGDDEDEEEEEEDEDGGDEEEEENPEDDKDQPPVTSGGLYTMETYPQREISRPLNLTQKLTQIRLGVGTDISAKGAFESFGVSLEALHGYSDNFTIIGGFTSAYNFNQFGAYLGFEGALAYDLVNIRIAANIHRNALPQYDFFCNPPGPPGEVAMNAMNCENAPDASLDLLPSGNFNSGGIKFGLDIGFPFRYAIRPEIAIVALQTLMTIDFNSVDQDYVTVVNNEAFDPEMPDSGIPPLRSQVTGNGAKPDLNPSVGIATNPIAPVSIVLFGQLRIPDFDTSAGAFQIPVTGRVQFSPNQKLDIGMEFTLLNVKPPDGQSPIDNRYLSLFIQSRLGK